MDDIPQSVRLAVLRRDGVDSEGGVNCRVCGQYLTNPALHHLVFRSQQGLHVPENLISIGWTPYDCQCHLIHAHGPEAGLWREIFQEIVDKPFLTAFQVRGWMDPGWARRGMLRDR